jgi:hypothetical protein
MGKCGIGVGFEGGKDSKQVFDGFKMSGDPATQNFEENLNKNSPRIHHKKKFISLKAFQKHPQQNNKLRSKY